MSKPGLEKAGYLYVKQPEKLKGRKIKSWTLRWIVLHQMSDLAAGTYAAKLDIYIDDKTASKSQSDKLTLIFDNVTAIAQAKSKKHVNAFEIVETEAVLRLAGCNKLDTEEWISAFEQIFWPGKKTEIREDTFEVVIIANEDAKRLDLQGRYQMIVSTECISISTHDHHKSYQWPLNKLKRFQLEHDSKIHGELFVIECGDKSDCGEAVFKFKSTSVLDILVSIKKHIQLAIQQKKVSRRSVATDATKECSPSLESNQQRSSVTSTENNAHILLDSNRNGYEAEDFGLETSNIQEKIRKNSNQTNGAVNEENSLHKEVEEDNNRESNERNSEETNLHDDTESSTEYNHLTFVKPSASAPILNQNEDAILLDERGYAHVPLRKHDTCPAQEESDKPRTLSNMSSQSTFSYRSSSTSSKDSGVTSSSECRQKNSIEKSIFTHKTTNSFDSAISSMSAPDFPANVTSNSMIGSGIHVEIEELVMTEDELKKQKDNQRQPIDNVVHSEEDALYADLDCSMADIENGRKTPLQKSHSTGDFKKHAEEHKNPTKFKKNLQKHLGIDPTVDPTSVPPSLPDRPSSSKLSRKQLGKEKKASDKKSFLHLLSKTRGRKERQRTISISSESDSDTNMGANSKPKSEVSTVKTWPLQAGSSNTGDNSLYVPINIERFLHDNNDVPASINVRERSSSLDLKRFDRLKRPSVVSDESVTTQTTFRQPKPQVVDLLTGDEHVTTQSSDLKLSCSPDSSSSATIESMFLDHDIVDERIYAEVECDGDELKVVEPFPNIAVWTPPKTHSFQFESSEFETTETHEKERKVEEALLVDIFTMTTMEECTDKRQQWSGLSETDVIPSINDSTDRDHAFESQTLFELFDPLGTMNTCEAQLGNVCCLGGDPWDYDPMVSNKQAQTDLSEWANFDNLYSMTELDFHGKVENKILPIVDSSAGTCSANNPTPEGRPTETEDPYMDMNAINKDEIYVLPSIVKTQENK